jgi:hypothetical protein
MSIDVADTVIRQAASEPGVAPEEISATSLGASSTSIAHSSTPAPYAATSHLFGIAMQAYFSTPSRIDVEMKADDVEKSAKLSTLDVCFAASTGLISTSCGSSSASKSCCSTLCRHISTLFGLSSTLKSEISTQFALISTSIGHSSTLNEYFSTPNQYISTPNKYISTLTGFARR